MARYRANAHVLNLNVHDEFTSDDPFYEPFAKQGYLTRLAELPTDDDEGGDDDGSSGSTAGAAAGGADEGDDQGTD